MAEREFEGKDLQEALEAAATSLGIAEPDLDYKILEQGRRGLFGIGAKSVRIRVMPPLGQLPDVDHAEAAPRRREPRETAPPREPRAGRERREAPAGRERREAPAGRERRDTPAGREASEPRSGRPDRGPRERRRRGGRSREGKRARPAAQQKAPVERPPVREEDARAVEETLRRMIGLMSLEIDVAMSTDDGRVQLRLSGPDSDVLTQKDGDALSALQFVLNRMARRTWPDAGRIRLSADGDKRGRDEDLVELTREVAQEVAETGRTKRLRQMNAYERRLVHLTVREFEGLGSRSEGNAYLKRVRIFRQGPDKRPE